MTALHLSEISSIKKNISDLKIQGATNVAYAVLDGMELVMKCLKKEGAYEIFDAVQRVGENLANTRPNEPLARNAVKYVLSRILIKDSPEKIRTTVLNSIKSYRELIQYTNSKIVNYGCTALSKSKVILTHCHSSTTTAILKKLAVNSEVDVVVTETRPMYQGRITTSELVEAGVNTYMITDSSMTSFVIDDRYVPVDSVIIGCDELYHDGAFLNKVGSYGISVAAKEGKDPLYVAVSLLKMDLKKPATYRNIEWREDKEVWQNPPEGLKIINPSFDLVDSKYVTGGYITEVGLLKAGELYEKAKELYPWMGE